MDQRSPPVSSRNNWEYTQAITRIRQFAGWAAVLTSLAISTLWAFWGAIEAFHEGWYYRDLWQNLALTLGQYLSPMFAFLLAALLSLRWPWLGAIAHLALAAAAALYVNTPSGRTLIVLPLVLLSLAYFVGRPQPVRLARRSLLLPLAVALAFGAWPAYRVATRPHLPIDAPLLRNHLIWAAPGPAWPKTGANWHAATAACAAQSMRLPTARELVEALTYRNQPAGGNWDPRSMLTTYQITPAKEPPLWDPYSPVIYWWTSTVLLDGRAIRIAHNGRAMPTRKDAAPAYYGFRCVTPVTAAPPPPTPR